MPKRSTKKAARTASSAERRTTRPKKTISDFKNVRTEGVLLPVDILSKIAADDGTLEGLRTEDYHLFPGEKLNERITEVWTKLKKCWEIFKRKRSELPDKDYGTTVTRRDWLLPLFRLLDYGTLEFHKEYPEIEGKAYAISHYFKEPAAVHLVSFKQNLDERDTENIAGAKVSPHSTVQEFLNQSTKHLWGFVTNGLQFRILRDNVSLIRAAYVEFDLENIMDSDSYGDFYLLYMLAHQSRMEYPKQEIDAVAVGENDSFDESETVPEEPLTDTRCWLEKWYDSSKEIGVRVRDLLREGVEKAINTLGGGFLAHRQNAELKRRLFSGKLSKQDYYNQILRVVYRILFLLVAEDRELLFGPNIPKATRELYTKYYSVSRIRKLAKRNRGSLHHDLWEQLNLDFQWFYAGEEKLGIPAFGSTFFHADFVPDLVKCKIKNRDLLAALRHLMFTRMNNVLQPINYRNIGTEELGSVYESLLEMHPEIEGNRFTLNVVAGSERKTTGSYYTPPSLVESLLDTALDPVVEATLKKAKTTEEKTGAILKLSVCDPACGSGHFLIGAAHRLGKRLAQIRSGEDEPSLAATQHAVRDVIGHCIYGVDINPMSVELCKVSLWIESMEPGKALMFLDHRIKCGNSLLGTTPELLAEGIPDDAFKPIEGDDKAYCSKWKQLNREELTGQNQFDFDSETPFEMMLKVDKKAKDIDTLPNETAKDYENKEKAYWSYRNSAEFRVEKLKADLWCAAFVWKKTDKFDFPITQKQLILAQKEQNFLLPCMKQELDRLVEQYQFFHWHLEFPEVLPTKTEPAGESGGFDVVLGNPPWERVKLQEKEWFAQRDPAIANAPNAAARKKLIDELKKNDPSLLQAFREAQRQAEGASQFIRCSGRYPLCGRGDVNTYTIFAELNRQILSSIGRVGCIVPSGIATDDTTKYFFQDLMEKRTLASLYDFENRKAIFPGVHRSYKFSLLTMCSPESPIETGAELAFFAWDTKDLEEDDKIFCLTPDEIAMINPNTRTCPIFRSVKDAELTKAIYRRVPVLIREAKDGQNEINPWKIRIRRAFDMGNKLIASLCQSSLPDLNESYCRMFESKMMHQYDCLWASYYNDKPEPVIKTTDHIPIRSFPRYWISVDTVEQRIALQSKLNDGIAWDRQWLIGWRDITNTTNERTVICAIIPREATDFTLRLCYSEVRDSFLYAGLPGILNSYAFDFVARQLCGGTHLSDYIMKQLPVLAESEFQKTLFQQNTRFIDFVLPRTIELVYISNDLSNYANDCGFDGEPFRWNEGRRFLLRCELDAVFFGLYLGFDDWSEATEYEETSEQRVELTKYFPTPRDAIDYIMDTFPIVKRKDEAKYGSYKTKETILSIYDDMVQAIRTGTDYQTRLDPPPAHDSVRHGDTPGYHTPDSLRVLAALERIRQLSDGDKLACSLFLNLISRNPSFSSAEHCLAEVIGCSPQECKPLLDVGKQQIHSTILNTRKQVSISKTWLEFRELLEQANVILIDRFSDNQQKMSLSGNYEKACGILPQSDKLVLFTEDVLSIVKKIITSERLHENIYSPEMVGFTLSLTQLMENQIAPLNISGVIA